MGAPKRVVGYQLDNPEVRLSANNVIRAKEGSLMFKDKVKEAVEFRDYAIVYSQGNNYPKNDDDAADDFVDLMFTASKAYNFKLSKPGFITCDSNIKSWKEEIKRDIDKSGKPQILILFFNNHEEKFYGELKNYITCELKLPCQAVRRRTVGKGAKSALSAASKILIQMNQKIGGVAW